MPRGVVPAELSLRWWSTPEGLPQRNVLAIEQTRDGFLWVGTLGGLARFDGVSFQGFGLQDRADSPGERVLALEEDRSGCLWIGTDRNGLACYTAGEFTRYVEFASLGPIRDIVEDGAGTLWLQGERLGALRNGIPDLDARGELSLHIRDLQVGPEGALHLAAWEGVYRERGGRFEPLLEGSDLGRVRRLLLGPNGRLWAVAARGIGVVEDDRLVRVFERSFGPGVRGAFGWGRLLLADRSGNLTLDLREEGGAVQLAPAGPEWTLPETYSDAQYLLPDAEGHVWGGFDGEGLARVCLEPFVRMGPTRLGFKAVEVVAGPNATWFGAHGVLYRCRDGRFEHIDLPRPPWASRVGLAPLAAGADGALWVGADRRSFVGRWADERVEWHTLDTPARGAAVDATGATWFGQTDGRMVRVDGGETRSFDVPGVEGEARVHRCEGDDVWFSYTGGIGRLRRGAEPRVERIPFTGAAARAECRSIVPDARGRVWISSYGGGLICWSAGELSYFGLEQGLVDASLGGLVLHDERLWINSNSGVQVLPLAGFDELARGERARLSPRTLSTGECDMGYAAKGPEGRLWFPTVDGLCIVDPTRLRPSGVTPRVWVEAVRGGPAGEEPGSFSAAAPVALPAGTEHLEVDYTAILCEAPEQVRFRYRLEGYSNEWVNVGARRTAYFTGVPPGEYEFVVQAASPDGGWSEPGARASIRLLAHFYESSWFRGLGLFALLATGLALYRWRVGSLARRNELLRRELCARERAELAEREKHRLAERLRETERLELLGRLSAGAAHDFNNVLTVILGRAELLSKFQSSEELADHAAIIRECGERAANLTRQLLAIGHGESEQAQSLDPVEVVAGLEPLLRQILPERIRLELRCGDDRDWVRVGPGQLEQVVFNLVLNARDAMPEGGTLTIETGATVAPGEGGDDAARFALLRVRDTGEGIDQELLPHVFEPFFTTKAGRSSGQPGGYGLGLASVHGIVSQAGGSIRVSSRVAGDEPDEPARGTTFDVLIPIAHPVELIPAARGGGETTRTPAGHVLLCEDYEPVLHLVSERLGNAGFAVHVAATPSDALQKAKELPELQLLLVDVDLPEMSGSELARRVERLHPGLIVVVMSGYSADGRHVAGFGRDWHFLRKPFSNQQLLETVGKALGARG